MKETELIDLTQIFNVIFKAVKKLYKIMVLIPLVFILIIEVHSIVTYEPVYQSSMTVVVSAGLDNILVSDENSEQTQKVFSQLLLSPSMQKILKNDLKVDVLPASISVSIVPDTSFLTITTTSSNQEGAYQVIQAIQRNYASLSTINDQLSMFILNEPQKAKNTANEVSFMQTAIKGGLIGIILDIAILAIYTLTRKTIIRESDIKSILHLKTLGTVPLIPKRKSKVSQQEKLLITSDLVSRNYSHAFKSLSLTLQKDLQNKAIMITSTMPNEGKSTTSVNLALALGKLGKKVCLVDLDLRNPSIYKILRIKNQHGYSSYVNEHLKLNEITEHTQGIDVISGGIPIDQPLSYFDEHLKQFIDELKASYDIVILDTPPVLMMVDALSVLPYVDETILVIKEDTAKVYEIAETCNQINENEGHIKGCIYNGKEDTIINKYGYGYGYYGYGYGYGYYGKES